MENGNHKRKDPSGIDKLMATIDQIANEQQRLTREQVTAFLNQIKKEIPYTIHVIPDSLADNLISDAPHGQNNLELNEVLVNLAKALFDPDQKDTIASLIHTYRHDRKQTKKEYAKNLLPDVLKETNIKTFSEKAQVALHELAQAILEKIINEKQLRKTSGYRLHPLIDIVESFLYQRYRNPELERTKHQQTFAFRKFVNCVAQTAYENVHDDAILTVIQKEKFAAFENFKKALLPRVSTAAHLKKIQVIFAFLHHDQKQKYIALKKYTNEIFQPETQPKDKQFLVKHLQVRICDKLGKIFRIVDLDPDIYRSEETIKKLHDAALEEAKEDADALNFLLRRCYSIQTQFYQKMLHFFSGREFFNAFNSALTDILLGKNIVKIDPVTAETETVRVGGYPLKNTIEAYQAVINFLSAKKDTLKGWFTEELKQTINLAIEELQTASKNLRVVTHAPPVPKRPMEEPEKIAKEKAEAMLKSLVESQGMVQETPPPVATEPQTILDEQFDVEPITLEKVAEEPQTSTGVNEPLAVEPITLEKVSPAPVPMAEEPQAQPEEQFDIEPITLEKVTVAPLSVSEEPQIDDLLEREVNATEDPGVQIMRNYQLGSLEENVYEAWKMMTQNATDTSTDMGVGSDNEVRLYVICDLVQQISNIQEDQLTSVQQQTLQDIKSQIITALKDPLAEQNWDYFEGTHRDYIDGALSTL